MAGKLYCQSCSFSKSLHCYAPKPPQGIVKPALQRLRDSYSAKARELADQLLSLQVGAGLVGGSGLEGHFKNLNMRGHEAGLG